MEVVDAAVDEDGRDDQRGQDDGQGHRERATVAAEPAVGTVEERLAGEPERPVVGHRLEVDRQVGRRGVAVRRLRGQAAADDRLERGGDLGAVVRSRGAPARRISAAVSRASPTESASRGVGNGRTPIRAS